MVNRKKIRIRRSGFYSRALAAFIDIFIWLVIWFQTHMLLVNYTRLPSHLLQLPDKLFLVVLFLYFVLMEGLSGATIGKLIAGLQVRDNKLKKINLPHSFARNLTKVVSIIPVFIGYFMIILRKDKMALHDQLTNSLVVRIEKK